MAHILAVDDEPDVCALVRTALERDGHTVRTCAAGGEVTEALCRWADCILLDIMMPGEDGVALCRRIRALTDAPVLFLTAKSEEADVLTALGAGGGRLPEQALPPGRAARACGCPPAAAAARFPPRAPPAARRAGL